MKNIIIIISISLLFLIVGCQKVSDNPIVPTGSNGLFHLKIGDKATLVFKEYFVKNGVDSLIKQYEFTSTILRDTVFDGFTWYSDMVPAKSWVTNKNDGVWQADPQPDGRLNIFMTFKYPCSKGDTFSSLGGNTLIVTTDTTISVAAGTFKCIQYRTIGQYYYEDTYVSPGLGVIKDFSFSWYSQSKIIIDLKSYSFK